jgi:hypothetical protein
MVFGPFFPLFIILLILKLTHVVDWSWWWITSPLWATLLIVPVLVILLILGVLSGATILMILLRPLWFWTRRDY